MQLKEKMKKITIIFCILQLILSIAVVGVFADQPKVSPAEKKRIINELLAKQGESDLTVQAAIALTMHKLNLPPAGSIQTAILQTMQTVKGSAAEKEQMINELLAGNGDQPMSTQDAMRLQYQWMQLNLQTETTMKASDKFKNQ